MAWSAYIFLPNIPRHGMVGIYFLPNIPRHGMVGIYFLPNIPRHGMVGNVVKKLCTKRCRVFWRRHPDLNRGIKVLQTLALPLGYSAASAAYSAEKKKNSTDILERETRFEPATFTLAR